ncbi:MAG: DUF1214 domain-containing protein [Novosphingobium sp.]
MTSSEAAALPQWSDYLGLLAKADSVLDLLADPGDPLARQEAYRLMFMALAAGFQSTFVDPDHPEFVCSVSNVMNSVGVNPDFIYGSASIRGEGAYRLSGKRGGGVFVLFDINAGSIGVLDAFGPSVGFIDLDECTLGPDGSFDILISAERPEGHTGDWVKLDPRACNIAVRRAYYNWGVEEEAKIAIERVDRPIGPVRLDAAEIARRLTALSGFVERYVGFAMGYGVRQRAQDVVNRLEHDDWARRGGLSGQHYYQGIFALEPGQAMILETAVPETVRYWNIQLNDPLWNSIEWFNRQSSLNAAQATLDSDGKFRAVIALEDPGVPNWLDPGGHLTGSLMLRWTQANYGPVPRLTIVDAASVRDHLPADTPVVRPEERQQVLRRRLRGSQWRHRW